MRRTASTTGIQGEIAAALMNRQCPGLANKAKSRRILSTSGSGKLYQPALTETRRASAGPALDNSILSTPSFMTALTLSASMASERVKERS